MKQSYKDFYFKKKILITGGLGFIGSNLARKLVELGANVTLMDSLIPEYGGNPFNISDIKSRLDVNISDVRDRYGMNYLIQGHDILFNLAGQTSHMDSMENPFTDLEINCTAQLSILEACRKFNPEIKIIYASTRQLYGKPQYLPVDENHPVNPVDINGINKLSGEQYHLLYNSVHDIKSCALRLSNTFGPRMRIKDDKQTFIGIWIRNILEKKPIKIFGNGLQIRDLIYIDDIINAFLLLGINDKINGKIFNIGNCEKISLIELAKELIECNNGKGEYELIDFPRERKKIDIGDYYGNYSLVKEMIGWEPTTSISQGINKTLNFYREYKKFYI